MINAGSQMRKIKSDLPNIVLLLQLYITSITIKWDSVLKKWFCVNARNLFLYHSVSIPIFVWFSKNICPSVRSSTFFFGYCFYFHFVLFSLGGFFLLLSFEHYLCVSRQQQKRWPEKWKTYGEHTSSILMLDFESQQQ